MQRLAQPPVRPIALADPRRFPVASDGAKPTRSCLRVSDVQIRSRTAAGAKPMSHRRAADLASIDRGSSELRHPEAGFLCGKLTYSKRLHQPLGRSSAIRKLVRAAHEAPVQPAAPIHRRDRIVHPRSL